MKNVKELTEKLVAEEKELMGLCVKQMNYEGIIDIGADEFEVITKSMKLINTANDVMIEQARLLVELNEKIDLLLKQKKD